MLRAIGTWDAAALLWIQNTLRTPLGDLLLPLWSRLGDGGLVWIAAAAVLLCFARTRRAGMLAAGGLLIDLAVLNGVLKRLAARPRPWLVVEGLETLLRSGDPNSFPSGHTGAAFAFAAVVWHEVRAPWARALAVLAAALMGWSRLYVGVHFPSDVLAGAVVGWTCGALAVRLCRRFRPRPAQLDDPS